MGAVAFRRCPACGAVFECHSQTGNRCWCMDIKLSDKQLEHIKKTYDGCLCPKCLTAFASSKKLEKSNK